MLAFVLPESLGETGPGIVTGSESTCQAKVRDETTTSPIVDPQRYRTVCFRPPKSPTAMSRPPLAPELLDHIVDFLHNSRDALKSCCLVSKQWIHRTREHLFSRIHFYDAEDLEAWKNTFPDPSTAPAYHTRTLSIECPRKVVAADAEEGGWIRAFSRVVELVIDDQEDGPTISLVPFHGFSLATKSLTLSVSIATPSQVLDLVCSFPLLEDLSVTIYAEWISDDDHVNEQRTAIQSPSLLPLTGYLKLYH